MTSIIQSSTLFPYSTLFRSGMKSEPSSATPNTRTDRSDTAASASSRLACETVSSPSVRTIMLARMLERSEEHTSELQSRENIVCRLLLEKKNNYDELQMIIS